MRVLYLAPPAPGPDGLTAYSFVDEEALALRDRGVELFLITDEPRTRGLPAGTYFRSLPAGRDGAERARTVRFITSGARRLPIRAALAQPAHAYHLLRIERFAAHVVREESIDLIHSHFGYPGGLGGLLAARSTHVPVVASFRGMDLLVDASIDLGLRLDPFYDGMLPRLLREADHTTYVSEFMRRAGLALGARAERAVTILKGVDLERFTVDPDPDAVRRELGLDGHVVLAVCGLQRLKGLDIVLRALALLHATHKFTFVICGTGEEREPLARLAVELGLGDRVEFRGKVSRADVARYFAACHVFVLASRVEASGNVLLEALAAGRATVSTDAGGPAEYIADNETGFVVPVDDVAAFADRVRRLLDDESLRIAMGRAGRRRAETRFAYARMIDDILRVYDDALTG